ncbi:MAG: hypothetical protein Tp152SUR00d2C52646391_65 [Prokaryotic dsDNA virus sp.]|nr:MAG: hypothetical protein Tp152SUR00d2C52646391_65 [Prokaryotic dsDNA virus sp.]
MFDLTVFELYIVFSYIFMITFLFVRVVQLLKADIPVRDCIVHLAVYFVAMVSAPIWLPVILAIILAIHT